MATPFRWRTKSSQPTCLTVLTNEVFLTAAQQEKKKKKTTVWFGSVLIPSQAMHINVIKRHNTCIQMDVCKIKYVLCINNINNYTILNNIIVIIPILNNNINNSDLNFSATHTLKLTYIHK